MPGRSDLPRGRATREVGAVRSDQLRLQWRARHGWSAHRGISGWRGRYRRARTSTPRARVTRSSRRHRASGV